MTVVVILYFLFKYTFKTILLHAEKISNGQIDFSEVLHDELKNKLGIDDIELLIDYFKQNEVPTYRIKPAYF